MQIRNDNTHSGNEAARTQGQQIDFTKSNREGILDSLERAREADRAAIPTAAEAADGHLATGGASETTEERAERLTGLRAEVEAGTLNSAPRIQKAAENLLKD